MAIQPTQPQSIGGVLDVSFQLYKASVASVWPVCLLLVLGSVPSLFFAMQASTAAASGDPTAALDIFGDPRYWLAILLTIAISVLASGAMYLKQQAIANDQELGLGSALQTSLGRLLPQVLTFILYSLAVGIGFVLLLVPGFILMLSLMLCWLLVVLETKGPVAALTGSHRLVWGNWWRTAAILTVGFIILIVLYIAVGFLVELLTRLVAVDGDPFTVAFVSGLIINGVLYLLATPYYAALLLSVYWDLKLRKEGGDLVARVGALGAA
jgi:hypothetical protein